MADNNDTLLINKDNYTANLIPDLSYFSYYENLLAFNKKTNMINDLFIKHIFTVTKSGPSTNPKIETSPVTIKSTRCLLLSDFILALKNGKDKANRKTEFAEIGRYGSRHVYCFYRNDEDSDNTSYTVEVTDDDKYDDKYFEELRF